MLQIVKLLSDLEDLDDKILRKTLEMDGFTKADDIASIYRAKVKIQEAIVEQLQDAYKYDIKRYRVRMEKDDPKS